MAAAQGSKCWQAQSKSLLQLAVGSWQLKVEKRVGWKKVWLIASAKAQPSMEELVKDRRAKATHFRTFFTTF